MKHDDYAPSSQLPAYGLDLLVNKGESTALAESAKFNRTQFAAQANAVIDHVDEGIIVVQEDGVVFANSRAAAIARMPREEMLRNGYLRNVHPDDRALILDRHKRSMAGEAISSHCELRILDERGGVAWVDAGVSLVPWHGRPAVLVFLTDITARKALEEQLNSSLKEREAILNSTLVGISHNVDRRIVWVNDKYVEMTGFSRDELIGQSSRMFYDSEEAYLESGRESLAALLKEGVYTSECEIRRRNGEPFWVILSGRCVIEGYPDRGIIWSILDITARRKAEYDTRSALERQTELNELRSRFVSMTSHEFRTPLATILSSAELLRYYDGRMSEEDRVETLASIETSVHRMTRMLERVLLIGQSDAQMLEFQPSELHTDRLCKDIVAAATYEQPEGVKRLTYVFDSKRSTCHFDEKLLRHIFSNLLSNAIKYSPHGGMVRFYVSDAGDKTRFEVTDEGIGIPAAEIPHLFESFHRASNVGNIPGTGLGLSIVKKSVDLHGGTIAVSSMQGKGTRFTVIL